MTGLAFPTDAKIVREASDEDGTPTSNADDIPIDPALTGALDPALMAESNPPMKLEQRPSEIPQLNTFRRIEPVFDEVRQYSQGPQGDPFEPQPLPPYAMLVTAPPPPPAKPPKRKRKIRREEECSFCAGTDQRNKLNQPERMATCLECGRSGHPSCMQLTGISDIIRSYPWRCIECKICELCKEKGDDERLLFCDHCDRGWHTYCLNPPMTETPSGNWACPGCSSIPPNHPNPNGMLVDPMFQPPDTPMHVEEDTTGSAGRGTSVASTSQSALADAPPQPEVISKPRRGAGRPVGNRPPGKRGPGRPPRPKFAPTPSVEGEDAMDVEVEAEPTPVVTARSARARTVKRPRVTREVVPTDPEDDDDHGEPASSPIRPRRGRKPQNQPKEPSPGQSLPRVRLRLPSQNKGKGKEREEEESNSHGMFDDILDETDRDISKTQITRVDKVLYEKSRQVAEEKLRPPPGPPLTTGRSTTTTTSDYFDFSTPGPSRPLRSAALHQISTTLPGTPGLNGLSASPVPSTPGGPPLLLRPLDPNQLRIHTIRFGEYDIKTWYDAPFPEEYATIPDGRLWICEFCLKYMKSRFGALRHRIKCKARHPPGDEIYRDANVSIFEVDGRRNKIYCQNLCLLSKMFLDHKSLFYDVEPFLFYVITELDDVGYRFVGYFSKEKRSPKDYNVSCIMTLPVRQRKGWGNLLIDFSYLLSKKEERSGSPEKPLSALGAIGYRKYWTLALMRYLQHAPDKVSLEDIRVATSMTVEDICQTLTEQNMLYTRDSSPARMRPSPGQAIKYPKGRKNGIARRQLQRIQSTHDKDAENKGPFVAPKHYEIHFDREKVAAYLTDWERKGYLKLKPEKLQWTPYLLSRTAQESGMANETPAMATSIGESSSTSSYAVLSPNGIEKKESTSSLGLFSSSPAPEDPAPEEEEEDVLPTRSRRARTRSPKKTPSKAVRRVVSVDDEEPSVEVETPRRRPRLSKGITVSHPRSSRRGRRAVVVPDEGEEEEQTPRSLRASRGRHEPTPKKTRKRRREPSPEPVGEPEVEEEAGAESEAQEEEEVATRVNGTEEVWDLDAEGEEDAEGEIDPDFCV